MCATSDQIKTNVCIIFVDYLTLYRQLCTLKGKDLPIHVIIVTILRYDRLNIKTKIAYYYKVTGKTMQLIVKVLEVNNLLNCVLTNIYNYTYKAY